MTAETLSLFFDLADADTQSAVERYERLAEEYRHIRSVAYDKRTAAQMGRQRELEDALRELLAVPPAGYTLPAQAANLIAFAHFHGWQAWAQWTPPGWDGEPSVTVHVGRVLTEAERGSYVGEKWRFGLTWHSHGCAPGRVRRSGGIAVTPEQPGPHAVPSVKAIRAVIAAHPAPSP